MNVQNCYCTAPSISVGGGGGGMDKMFKFCVEVFYVMGKVLSGELSCMRTGLVILSVPIRS